MRDTRNPFRLRRAENIDTDTTFLSLFEPGILDVIAESGLPETVQLIRSAAGGGKTSLLRLFTPSVLRRLYMRRVEDQDLFSRLNDLGAIDDHGPKLLGVSLLCGRNYAVLEDLRLELTVRTRLFLGLLNARIILAVLRSALSLPGNVNTQPTWNSSRSVNLPRTPSRDPSRSSTPARVLLSTIGRGVLRRQSAVPWIVSAHYASRRCRGWTRCLPCRFCSLTT